MMVPVVVPVRAIAGMDLFVVTVRLVMVRRGR
jgi:hypothetical protein